MQKTGLSALALIVLALAGGAGDASALVQRTFVSGVGSDANDCSRTAPCRTFATAIAQTLPGGEVLALDTAGYGPVTINQSISLISPPGVYAGITTTAGGTDAITIAAGENDTVVLKGLSLTGLGLGSKGVSFTSGKALRVEGVTITGFTFRGIEFTTDFTPTGVAWLTVTDSLVRDSGVTGIYTEGVAGEQQARVAINRTTVMGQVGGVVAATNSRMSVRDSVVAGNLSTGFESFDSVLNIENCFSMGNGYGVYSNGLVRVAGTTVTENTTGLAGPGSLFSRGNNTVEGNVSDGLFTSTFAPK